MARQHRIRIDGRPVTRSTSFSREEIENLCQSALGVRPEEADIHKLSIRLTWLFDQFYEERLNNPELDVSNKILQCYIRAYILRLLGMRRTPDKSISLIHYKFFPLLQNFHEFGKYSWGSACPAILYQNLCRATRHNISKISGCL